MSRGKSLLAVSTSPLARLPGAVRTAGPGQLAQHPGQNATKPHRPVAKAQGGHILTSLQRPPSCVLQARRGRVHTLLGAPCLLSTPHMATRRQSRRKRQKPTHHRATHAPWFLRSPLSLLGPETALARPEGRTRHLSPRPTEFY